MKKLFSLLVCLGLCLGMLCGCQGGQPKEGALTQPPELTLSTGKTQALLRSGSYGWEYPTKSGQRVAVVADSIHPLDAQLSPVLGDGAGDPHLGGDGALYASVGYRPKRPGGIPGGVLGGEHLHLAGRGMDVWDPGRLAEPELWNPKRSRVRLFGCELISEKGRQCLPFFILPAPNPGFSCVSTGFRL